MSLINFSGIASGIDSSSLITALLDQERAARIVPLEDKISAFQDTNTAFTELKTLLNKLKDAAAPFRTLNGSVLEKNAASSDETIISATASNSASNGNYSLQVTQLAKNATFTFKSSAGAYSSADSLIGGSIVGTGTVTVETGQGADLESVSIDVDSSTTLSDFVTEFNSSSTKAVASLVNVGTSGSPDYRVVINSLSEGEQKGDIAVTVSSAVTNAGAFDTNSESEAKNALFTISGIGAGAGDTITRQSNSISDVIPGLTLNLNATGSATIAVADDSAATAASVQEFVDAYNEILAYIRENDSITREENGDEVNNIFGPLADSSLDEGILTALRNALSGSSTSGRDVNTLADLGIVTERDGTLSFDSAVFEEAVSTDPEAVRTITQTLGETLASTSGTIAQYTQFNGLIDQVLNSNTSQISSWEDQIALIEKSLAQQETSLTARYSRLESLIGQLNSQQSALASVLPK